MGLYEKSMRRMRTFVNETKLNHDRRAAALKELEPYRGSQHYDKRVAELDADIERKRVQIAENAKKDLIAMVGAMRENAAKRITRSPTTEITATLDILGQLENLTPTDITLFSQGMEDCPLALRRLREIAARHDIRVMVPDTDAALRAVDVLEGNFARVIGGYRGDDNEATAKSVSVGRLLPYFQDDAAFDGSPVKSTKNADTAFWQNVVQVSSPAALDGDAQAPGQIDAKLFFKDFDSLRSYIDKRTAGLTDTQQERERDAILAACPPQYGAYYRHFKATGNPPKLPMNSVPENPYKELLNEAET